MRRAEHACPTTHVGTYRCCTRCINIAGCNPEIRTLGLSLSDFIPSAMQPSVRPPSHRARTRTEKSRESGAEHRYTTVHLSFASTTRFCSTNRKKKKKKKKKNREWRVTVPKMKAPK
ncbi:hypothetical protein PUN28_010640 [Cardiocondyla obscurior]|uniref:Uncharacterized protein n=1 Tax=Cardiocondyla obscurior TaxID=286306 RepID=A0AAW2FH50_9HYME